MRVPVETREDHPRRHRRGEGRRRLAFRPLDAPRRDRVLQGVARPDRQGQAASPPPCSSRARRCRRSTTAASRRATPTAASIFSSSRKEAAQLHACRTTSRTASAVVTDNEMHDPVFPNGTAICEVEVDPDTGEVDDHPLRLGRRRRPLHQSADRATARPTARSRRASARRCGSSATSIRIPASR